FLSIDPILAVPGVRAALRRTAAPIVVVSPIVGGQAVKGPTAKIMAELGLCASSATVAAHYAGLIDGMVIDNCDAAQADALGLPVHVTQTLMRGDDDKRRLASAVLDFAATLNETLGKAPRTRSAA
ncbi:MAG TPA: 2-phospho-L-lactate transferase CofD family protein, partial [Ramlibacter sp.]|nr:2-phospho-L-lactate transferase CofD family protein [Ramlibacter sp.]